MFSKSKVKKVDFVTLSKFYGKYKEALQLELINSPAGLSRHICEPALNRPGLAIAGFYSYFANKRIQVFGSAELAYLQKLPEGMRKSRIQRMFRCEVPGIVFSRDQNPPREIVELADEAGVCVFRTSLVTMKFVNSATIILENEFAESVTLHGCMVDVRGVGVLIRGKSGRVFGDLMTLLSMQKGLSLAYNKDMQEDKEALFDVLDTVKHSLQVLIPMFETMRFNVENMKQAALGGFINATDCADYLTKKGVPFRDAYRTIGELVAWCIAHRCALNDVELDVLKQFHPLFEEDVYAAIDLQTCSTTSRSSSIFGSRASMSAFVISKSGL